MTKITLELIENAIQRTNPLKDREIDLKGNKISLIENLGTTLDQFDTIDFSDNEIHRFDGFPYLKRLTSINFTNNKIMKIGRDLNSFIPNITTLVLVGNNIQDLRELDNLACFKQLEFLALLRNPIALHQHYRQYIIHKLPQVRILDFSRIKDAERREAATLFGGKGVDISSVALKPRNVTNGVPKTNVDMDYEPRTKVVEPMEVAVNREPIRRKPTVADMIALKTAIQTATSMDEIDRLNYLLSCGQFAGFADSHRG